MTVDVWDLQRRKRQTSTDRNDYGWLPCPISIRHATKTLGMTRDAAIAAAFESMRQRDPARWGGPGA